MGETDPSVVEILDPEGITPDEEATVVAFIGGDGEFTGPEITIDRQNQTQNSVVKDYNDIENALKEPTQKFHSLSRQSRQELNDGVLQKGFSDKDIINPPYPPKCLANFLEVDPVFSRAVKAKVLDSVGRDYMIQARWPIQDDSAKDNFQKTITSEDFQVDQERIVAFIENCNDTIGFRGVLQRAAMDYEAIGWAGLEVIRNRRAEIVGLEHIPAQRLRVLKGFKGFVEQTAAGNPTDEGLYGRCYQPFGQKFLVEEDGEKVPYDPSRHPDVTPDDLISNFIDYRDGKPTDQFSESANEVLYIPKHHSNTIYYGYSDVLPAIGAMVGNVYIRDYVLQFFEHNTVPRYAVIIKGANVDDDFRKLITSYFTSEVRGSAHKTLIIALKGGAVPTKDVTVEFQKLDADRKEADFLETQKQNDQRIMTAMGTSPALLGIADKSELGSGKGLSQAEIYKDRIVTPSQRHWAEKLNMLFRKGLGVTNAVLKFDPLDIRDMLLEMQYWTGLQAAGDATINEVRKEMNVGEPVDGGSVPFIRIREGSAFKVEDIPKLPSTIAGDSVEDEIDDESSVDDSVE